MKKEAALHFLFLIPFFLFVSLIRRYLTLSSWPFWLGGIVGTIMPYLDHIIYIYVFAPHELSSQRFVSYINQKNPARAIDFMVDSAHERSKLVFHTFYFNAVLVVLTFWIITSSGSLLGKGIVLAFYLHLVIDQLEEYLNTKSLYSWFREITSVTPEWFTLRKTYLYLGINIVLLLLFGFVF